MTACLQETSVIATGAYKALRTVFNHLQLLSSKGRLQLAIIYKGGLTVLEKKGTDPKLRLQLKLLNLGLCSLKVIRLKYIFAL